MSVSRSTTAAVAPAEVVLDVAAELSQSTGRADLGARLAAGVVRVSGASLAVVSLRGSLAFVGDGVDATAASTAARRLRACDQLWAAVVSAGPAVLHRGAGREVRSVLDALGARAALVVGIDDEDAGFVLVAGPGLVPDRDQAVVVATATLAASVLRRLGDLERLTRAAEHDASSGFLSAAGLARRVDALAAAGGVPGLVSLQFDGLTALAAGFGAAAASSVVRDIGARISAVPGVVAIASLSPERLAVLVAGDAGAAGDQIVAVAAEPVRVGRHHLVLQPRAGAAGPATSARTLLDRAELARVEACASEHAIVVYTPALAEGCHRRLETASLLWRALEQGELVVHYQPQVDIAGELLAFEALVRWRLADGTMVPPSDFLPIAEHAGMAAELDLHVLELACRQLQMWDTEGHRDFRLAVNLSASTLARPGIAESVLGVVQASGADPRRIELEITESAAAGEDGWVEVLEQFRAVGMTIALDDFGTGFSSLGRIHRLPLDRLKIDRAFVADLAGTGATVVRAVVALAAELGLAVLAEGVEDPTTQAALAVLGVRELQGYWFGTPAPAEAVTARFVD